MRKKLVEGEQAAGRMSAHTAEGDERRRMIIQTAYDLIAEKGLGGLRVREVADRVGINNATLHYYFPTKESLIQVLAELLGQQFTDFSLPDQTAQITPASPKEQMHYYFLSVAEQIKTKPERFVIISDLFLAARRDSAIREVLGSDENWQGYLINILQEGVRQGQFRADLDVSQTALLIITFCKGLPLLVNAQSEDTTKLIVFMEQWFETVSKL